MDDVEKAILSYPHLTAEEQAEVETYVESNPEWAPLLRDVRSLEDLSRTAQERLPADDLLVSYVVVKHFHPDDVPPRLQEAFSRIEARIEEDPELNQRVEAVRRRLKEAESALDPVASFESLTGHSLEREPGKQGVGAVEPESEDALTDAPSLLEVFFTLPVLLRRGAVAILLLVGLYGTLFAFSVSTQSTLDRLAAVDVSDEVVESYVSTETRSAVPAPDTTATVDQQYVGALSALRSARNSTLGLFPHYDPETLARAEQRFEHVLDEVAPGSFLALEAHFYLGKIALAQGDVGPARNHFQTVVKREGRKKAEAAEILKTLQDVSRSQGN